jgi:hypothetical protein
VALGLAVSPEVWRTMSHRPGSSVAADSCRLQSLREKVSLNA